MEIWLLQGIKIGYDFLLNTVLAKLYQWLWVSILQMETLDILITKYKIIFPTNML